MIQISLKAARVNAGLKIVEASKMAKVHSQTLSKYEKDSSDISVSLLNKLSMIYQVPEDNIFLGKEYDLIRTINIKRKETI